MATLSVNKGPETPAKVCHLVAHRETISMWVTAEDGTRYILRLDVTDTSYLKTLLVHGTGPKKRRRKPKAQSKP